MKKFWQDEKGVITLFLVVIILAVFMFNAVLIDSARIMAAQKQTEYAVQAGVRSVLSNYHVDLMEYGLYGTNQDGAKNIFKTAVTLSLSPLKEERAQYLVLEEVAGGFEVECPPSGMLANTSVFEQQVLEEMKYKAAMQMISEFMHNNGGSENSLDKLDFNISEQLSKDEEFIDIANELQSLKEDRDYMLDTLHVEFNSIAEDIIKIAESDIDYSDAETPRTQEEIEKRQVELDNIGDSISVALDELNQAKRHDQKMADLIETHITLLSEYSDDPRETLLEDAYFTVYTKQLKSLKSFCSYSDLTEDDIDSIEDIQDVRETLEKERKKSAVNRDKAVADALKEANSDKPFDTGNADSIAESSTRNDDSKAKSFEQLKDGLAEKYYVSSESKTTYSNDNEDAATEAVKSLNDKFKSGMLSLFLSGRDNFYLNEYSLMYFNCKTTNNQSDDRLSQLRRKHLIGDEELEYIVYGLNQQNANLIAAGAEIYGIRLALHMSVGLKKFKYLIDPKLILIAAATYAAIMAANDTKDLLDGKTVAMYPDKAIKAGDVQMSYEDYMRLFLWQAGREKKINRMQALIELNTKIDLTETPGYIQGSAQTKLKLWFLPGVMQALGKAQNGYYYIERTAAMYY